MRTTTIVACPKCGQRIGIPEDSNTVHVTCPKCTAEWDWQAQGSSGRSTTSTRAAKPRHRPAQTGAYEPRHSEPTNPPLRGKRLVVGLVSLGIATFIGYRMLSYKPANPLPRPEASSSIQRRPIWNPPPEQPLPDNGHGLFAFDQSAADSRLRFFPRGEQGHVVLKVVDAADARLVCWIFIRQGESVEAPIPAGSYRLKLACGKKWYGEEDLFGPTAFYSAIANEINIPSRTAYTIDLHPSTTGTLKETTLRAEDF